MTRNEILDKLKEIMISINEDEREKIESSTEDTRLVEDIGLTSVGTLYLVIIIEDAFGIKFDDVGTASFATVGMVVDYIETKL